MTFCHVCKRDVPGSYTEHLIRCAKKPEPAKGDVADLFSQMDEILDHLKRTGSVDAPEKERPR